MHHEEQHQPKDCGSGTVLYPVPFSMHFGNELLLPFAHAARTWADLENFSAAVPFNDAGHEGIETDCGEHRHDDRKRPFRRHQVKQDGILGGFHPRTVNDDGLFRHDDSLLLRIADFSDQVENGLKTAGTAREFSAFQLHHDTARHFGFRNDRVLLAHRLDHATRHDFARLDVFGPVDFTRDTETRVVAHCHHFHAHSRSQQHQPFTGRHGTETGDMPGLNNAARVNETLREGFFSLDDGLDGLQGDGLLIHDVALDCCLRLAVCDSVTSF